VRKRFEIGFLAMGPHIVSNFLNSDGRFVRSSNVNGRERRRNPLTNPIKNAQARRFGTKFSFAAEEVTLQLTDDGRGFRP
jgi:hypothetical protein